MNMDNPRWPHKCRIYRYKGATNWDDGEIEVVYEGECRKYGNTSIRTFEGNSGVMKADYALSIPGRLEGAKTGDLVDVTDRCGEIRGAILSDCLTGNLGTTAYFNLSKN